MSSVPHVRAIDHAIYVSDFSINGHEFDMGRAKETITFDTRQLRLDLNERAPKWSAFENLARNASVPVKYDTYRRAKGGYATDDTLAKIARILDYPVERYLTPTIGVPQSARDLAGVWTAIYLEVPRPNTLVRTWERLHVTQHGQILSGYYDFWKTDDVETPGRAHPYAMKGRSYSDCVVGYYWVRHRLSAHGIGTFQLKLRPDGIVAEGFCSFYGHDGFVAASQNFWVRADGTAESAYQLRAAEEQLLRSNIFFEVPSPPGP